MIMKPVYSSWISQIGYDPETQTLMYQTQNGVTVVHPGVPLDVAQKVGAIGDQTPPSIGEAIHLFVRGQYGHVKDE
jgi:hypothetical protein